MKDDLDTDGLTSDAERLALGTVQFGQVYGIANRGGQIGLDEARAIIRFSRSSGIDTLDTAVGYGDSEARLGQIGVHDWQVVSKLPGIPASCDNVPEWVMNTCGEALRRLKVKHLYGLLLHRPKQLLEKNGDRLYEALQKLKLNGAVQKIGVSVYAPSELDALYGRFQFDIVQAPFNILDRRLIDTGWLYRMSEQGTELHARSVFLQGLLLMKATERPEHFHRWTVLWAKYDNWLSRADLTPLQACIRYALSFLEFDKVVIGVDNLAQLKDILSAAMGPMPEVPDDLHADDIDLLNPARWDNA